MGFVFGKSYLCRKDYGKEYQEKCRQANQFLSNLQDKSRGSYYSSYSYYGEDWRTTYYFEPEPPMTTFTAGNVYVCRIEGHLLDDNYRYVSETELNEEDFIPIDFNISDIVTRMIDKMKTYDITLDIRPTKVVGGEVKGGFIENPDASVTEVTINMSRVGSFGHKNGMVRPTIYEIVKVNVGRGDTIEQAIYDTWKKVRIKSPFCHFLHNVFEDRKPKESKWGSPRIYSWHL